MLHMQSSSYPLTTAPGRIFTEAYMVINRIHSSKYIKIVVSTTPLLSVGSEL